MVHRLGDEVGGECLLELLGAVAGMAALRERHRAGVEPGVQHVRYAAHDAAAFLAWNRHSVDVRPVQVGVVLQSDLRRRADATLLVAGLAHPERKRGSPVSRTRKLPIDVVAKPVPHPSFFDMRGNPVGGGVVGDELVLVLRGPDVPRIERVVDQRRSTPPAERICVKDRLGFVEQTSRLEVVDDQRVGLLDVETGELLDVRQELPVQSHGVCERDALLLAELEVVDAVQGRCMHHARAFFRGDEIRIDYVVSPPLLGDGVGKERLVVQTHEFAAFHRLDHCVLAVKHRQARLGQDQVLVALFDLDVRDVLVDGQRYVAGQRPGRGRPGEDRGVAVVLQPEPDEDARVGNVVLIAQCQLVARQWRGASGAVRRDAKAFVDEVLVPHLAERPPNRLDVIGRQRPVGVVVVEPKGHSLAESDPVGDVLVDALAAQLVEALDTDLGLDVGLAGDAQLLLDLDLDRQPVCIPAGLALDVEPLHRLVAREEVLEGAREDVVRGRPAVGGGRPFVEDKARAPGTELERLSEGVFRLPFREHLLLEVREADLLVYLVEHLTPREIWIDLWDEPRAAGPRYHPDFRGCHLGRSSGSGSGVISAPSSAARLSARCLALCRPLKRA